MEYSDIKNLTPNQMREKFGWATFFYHTEGKADRCGWQVHTSPIGISVYWAIDAHDDSYYQADYVPELTVRFTAFGKAVTMGQILERVMKVLE